MFNNWHGLINKMEFIKVKLLDEESLQVKLKISSCQI